MSYTGKEIGRRLSVGEFYAKDDIQAKVLADRETPHFLARFVGIAEGLIEYTTRTRGDDGEFLSGYGLIGEFEGQSADGEVKNGGTLYLPGYVQNRYIAALKGGADSVEIAIDVFAMHDNKAATSYVFTAYTLNGGESKLATLQNALDLPALPTAAPVKAIAGKK